MAHNANSCFTVLTKGAHIGYGVLVTSKVSKYQYGLVVKGQGRSLLKICNKLPPEFFCQTSFWQNDLVLLVDIES